RQGSDDQKAPEAPKTLGQKSRSQGAHRAGKADQRSAHAAGQIETPSASGKVADHQYGQHPDDGAGYTIEQLCNGENAVIGAQGQDGSAYRFQPEPDQEQGTATPLLGVIPHPRSKQGDHNLRDYDQARYGQ